MRQEHGFGRFPSRDFHINSAWLELSLTAIDLLSWLRILLLDGELAAAEPKKLRCLMTNVPVSMTGQGPDGRAGGCHGRGPDGYRANRLIR